MQRRRAWSLSDATDKKYDVSERVNSTARASNEYGLSKERISTSQTKDESLT